MKERWKYIKGYEGLYKISTLGNLYCEPRCWYFGVRNTAKRCSDGYYPACQIGNSGYIHATLIKDGKPKGFSLHRLVALTFIPNPEQKETVNHIDGVKTNNCLENLEWNTMKENRDHAQRNGLLEGINLGVKNGASKLNPTKAAQIRKSSGTNTTLAKQFQVSRKTIRDIKEGKTWKCIPIDLADLPVVTCEL